jgi:hypothetical protein
MFSLFEKEPFTTSDKVWMTKEECWKGLATEALTAITRKEVPVVISFFDDVHDEAIGFFIQQGVPYFDWRIESIVEGNEQNIVYLVHADQVEHLLKANTRIGKSPVRFLFTSHYPLIAPEERLLNNLHTLTKTNSFLFFISLSSPLMEVFGADNIKSIMTKLGIKQDECVEHAMVTKSIFRAREKITQSVQNENRSRNEKEWFQKNVKTPL